MNSMRQKTDASNPLGSGATARGPNAALAAGTLLAAICLAPACVTGTATPVTPNVPPTANFVYNPVSPIIAGQTKVTFDGSSNVDTDGNIASYVWTFGDGSAAQTLTTPIVTHVFPDTPVTCDTVVYSVQLTVVDNQGARTSVSQQVSVTELPDPRTGCTPGTSG
jgi:PKD repeat protein